MHAACRLDVSSSDKLNRSRNRKKKREQEELAASKEDELVVVPDPKRLRSSVGIVHDKNLCVWCMKPEDKRHPERTGKWLLMSYLQAWNAFKRHTVVLQDDVMRERINRLIDSVTDPFSTEIRYHHKCWLKYVGSYQKMAVEEQHNMLNQVTFREAQTMFMDHVRCVIFEEHEIRSLQSLLRDYKSIVGTYGFPISGVKSSYVKEILLREFGDHIGFHQRLQKKQGEVVYDANGAVSYVDAAISSLGVGDQQLIENLAKRLRNDVNQTETLPWPPKVAELEQKEEFSPLVTQLISSLKKPGHPDDDVKACALSSLITYYVTGKATTTAVNLAMTLHGLTRSKELVDLFHKCGMGISYASVLLLRDAWAVHDMELCNECPHEIAESTPGVIVVDNDDFRNDTLTGGDTSHRTNVMYVQPLSLEHRDLQSGERVKARNVLSSKIKETTSDMTAHNRYITHRRGEPPVSDRVQSKASGTESLRKRCVIHALARGDAAGGRPTPTQQAVPSFAGFQALLADPIEKSKPYYFMTYPDPPKKSVLNDVMVKVNSAIAKKSMPFAVVVGDQPVYTLLVEIKSEHPQKFSKIIPFLGPFHIQCSMIYTIYKRHKGCELAEVLVSAGVIAEGSVDQALKGKHYRRGLRCLTLMYEALMHLLLSRESQLKTPTMDRLAILRDTSANSQEILSTAYQELEEDPVIDTLISNMFGKIESTDMATYWLEFMEMVEILMMNVFAVHTCNWDEYLISLRKMMPWMVIYDQTHYGRWLPQFWAMLVSLPPDKTMFFAENFAQSITGNPYSSIPWDLWIEMTMNKGSKLKAGWLSILRNEKQLMVDTRNANNLGRVRAAIHNQVNNKELSRKHNECAPARMRKDEQAVQDLLSCIEEFDCFPFDPASPILRTLQSAIPVPPDVVCNIASAKQDGESKLEEFMEERVYSKEKSINDRIKRNSRMTFAKAPARTSGKCCKVKEGEMENQALASVVNLVDVSGLISLPDIMKYRITEECLTLFHVNGTFRKTQKSKILQKLVEQPVTLTSYTALVDMGMIWRLATPTAEERDKADGSSYTWSDYAGKVGNLITTRHATSTTIICINDPYDCAESIKDDERELRSQKQAHIPNVYIKAADKFPSANDFKTFLCSSGNKKRLQNLIKSHLTNIAQDLDHVLIYSVGKECTNLSSGVSLEDLACDQCEADTIIFSVYTALQNSGNNDPVVIDAADTDVYIQAAAVSREFPGVLCIKKKQQLLSCRAMCPDEEIASCLIPFHVMTGCDSNSCFYGHGKATLYGKIVKSAEARKLLANCGLNLPLAPDVLNNLISFVIRYVYGDMRSLSLDMSRAAKWKAQKKKSLMRLPPDMDCLTHHIKRANYLSYLQRHPEQKAHPSPIGHGWELVNGRCKPVRHTKSSLPISLPSQHEPFENSCDSEAESEEFDFSDSEFDTSSDELF